MAQLETLVIKRDKLSDQIANKIQEMILQGSLNPGDQLPPERVLVEQLGVSRTVVREAFRLLQERGLVRIITGSGTYVSKADPGAASLSIGMLLSRQKNDFQDLIEIRRFLEVEIATLAAERATPGQIEALAETIDRMRDAIPGISASPENLERFVQADLDFHSLLAEATGNALYPVLLASIVDLLIDFRRQASSQPGAPEAALHYHMAVLECVRSHDPETVRRIMREHMDHAEQAVARAGLTDNGPV